MGIRVSVIIAAIIVIAVLISHHQDYRQWNSQPGLMKAWLVYLAVTAIMLISLTFAAMIRV